MPSLSPSKQEEPGSSHHPLTTMRLDARCRRRYAVCSTSPPIAVKAKFKQLCCMHFTCPYVLAC